MNSINWGDGRELLRKKFESKKWQNPIDKIYMSASDCLPFAEFPKFLNKRKKSNSVIFLNYLITFFKF